MNSELECSNFNEYPHYVHATVFLLDDKLMDWKIGNRQSHWGLRTFRGLKWERYVWDNFENLNLHCKYKKILVNNDEEHNQAFEYLKKWILKNFDISYEVSK